MEELRDEVVAGRQVEVRGELFQADDAVGRVRHLLEGAQELALDLRVVQAELFAQFGHADQADVGRHAHLLGQVHHAAVLVRVVDHGQLQRTAAKIKQ